MKKMNYNYPSFNRTRKSCDIEDLLWLKSKLICVYEGISMVDFINTAIFEFVVKHEGIYKDNKPEKAIALGSLEKECGFNNEENSY